MSPVSDVDEVIENEVCSRLIRLSCAKMVNSKSERGGAKLHRNLLILHLLRRARDEQKRYPTYANNQEWVKEPEVGGDGPMMMPSFPSNTAASATCTAASQYINVDGDDDEEEEEDDEDDTEEQATHLLDLSKCHEPMHLGNDDGSMMNQVPLDFDYSTLRLAPLQYTFAGPEMYGVDESTSTQQHMYGMSALNPNVYFPEQTISTHTAINQQVEQQVEQRQEEDKEEQEEDKEEQEEDKEEQEKEKEEEMEKAESPVSDDSGCDCSADSAAHAAAAPVSESTTSDDDEDEASSSCSSDDEEEGEDEKGQKVPYARNPAPSSTNPSRRRRKRKTSAQRLPSPCSAKKCCGEERQLTGLISVFNSGLTVVADQFLARPAASTVSTLQQQTPKQINSFMHIACNPLIC